MKPTLRSLLITICCSLDHFLDLRCKRDVTVSMQDQKILKHTYLFYTRPHKLLALKLMVLT